MKNIRLCLFSLGFLAASVAAFAQDTSASFSLDSYISNFIAGLALKYPVLLTVLSVIGVLRLVCKPIMSAIQSYVAQTESTTDDETLAKVEHSVAFRIFAWLLDYTASIKVGPQMKAPAPTAPTSSDGAL